MRLMDGGEAVVRSGTGHTPFVPGPDEVLVSLPVISELIAASGDFEKLLADNPEIDGLDTAVRRLHKALHPLYGQFVTGLFEENRRANGALSPVFAVFSRLLDEPNDSENPAEYEERMYRRWLAGRSDGVDNQTIERFEKRLGRGA
ncbi:hypothetical protein GCM10007304_14290 [Rhodococcoides trifolii]|uniref:Uncharacterized protein n=1 Tax=Rhodococcoides trifolii TaxID=908250 RepID=A0A917FRA3_9NOCA|nr:hypothetical protein GCM10007304_14290 [Rhodococcus trifolii]